MSVRDAIRASDLDAFKAVLAPDVVWVGVRPGLLCRGREQVVAMLDQPGNETRTFSAEIVGEADALIAVDPHPDPPPPELPTVHQVVVAVDDTVVELRDYPDRASALAALEPFGVGRAATPEPVLTQTIPALPASDVGAAAVFYRERLGFDVLHQAPGFAVVRRGDAEVHLWEASDESWRKRGPADAAVRSGAESYLAGTASCRIRTRGVDDLFAELRDADVLHPVSRAGVTTTDFGTREFATLDPDGNLIAFFEWMA